MSDRNLLTNALQGLQIDPAVVDTVMKTLTTRATVLEGARDTVAPVPAPWFGDSHTGGYRLATNAAMAQAAVEEEFLELVVGLRAYADEIKAFRDDAVATDEAVSAHLTAVQRTAECTSAPVIGGGECSAPTGEAGR